MKTGTSTVFVRASATALSIGLTWSPLPAGNQRAGEPGAHEEQYSSGFEWDNTTTTTASSTPSRSSSGPEETTGHEAGGEMPNVPLSPAPSAPLLQIATPDAGDSAAERFTGEPIEDRSGNHWGTVRDFLVHQETGQIEWVVVAAGGIMGVGETLRLVPYSKLQRKGRDRFRADLTGAEARRLPVITEESLELGQMAVMDTVSAMVAPVPADTVPMAASGGGGSGMGKTLVPASLVADRTVLIAGRPPGGIDAVVLDFRTGYARALVALPDAFGTAREPVLVPFGELIFAGKLDGPVASRLTGADFDRVHATAQSTRAAR